VNIRRLLALSLTLLGATSMNSPAAETAAVLITGANRGIGLALATGYAAKGWRVIATCRDPSTASDLQTLARQYTGVSLETLDVTSPKSIDKLAGKLRGTAIDVLINNAGILGDTDGQVLSNFDADNFDAVMRVNSYAPLRVASAFLEPVARSRQKKIVSLTSLSGSIAASSRVRSPYFYSMSKTALNMGMHQLQMDVRDRGVIVGLISPGPVDTDMNRNYRHGAPAGPGLLSPATSARAIIEFIDRLTPEMGGRFYEYTGGENPW
jgi:NAD(P)-dependent dehydrogenase (short-subunit alcohol dehydrogenase family)